MSDNMEFTLANMTLCACFLQGAAPLQVATQKGYASTTNVLLSHGAIAPL